MPTAEGEFKCSVRDMMLILGRSCKRMRDHDENTEPERLLKAARSAGNLVARLDVQSGGKSQMQMVKAREASGGLVNKANVAPPVRLLYEEGFHRCRLAAEDALRKRALCAPMMTMRSDELQNLVHEGMTHMNYFSSITEDSLKAIAQKMSSGATTLRDMPSFADVMSQADLTFEVMSLMRAHKYASKLEEFEKAMEDIRMARRRRNSLRSKRQRI